MGYEDLNEQSSIVMVSSTGAVDDFSNVIEIIDEQGLGLACTKAVFIEIFDREGLSGFVM
jgi:hypothetical protein